MAPNRELKVLPLEAWKYRAELVELYTELGKYPDGYHTVYIPSIGKKEKGIEPLDSRLLTLSSSLYGIEGGARFEILAKCCWRYARTGRTRHRMGCAGRLRGGEALAKGLARVLSSYGYDKFSDSFDYEWARNFLLFHGMPKNLVALTHELYTTLERMIKRRK